MPHTTPTQPQQFLCLVISEACLPGEGMVLQMTRYGGKTQRTVNPSADAFQGLNPWLATQRKRSLVSADRIMGRPSWCPALSDRVRLFALALGSFNAEPRLHSRGWRPISN